MLGIMRGDHVCTSSLNRGGLKHNRSMGVSGYLAELADVVFPRWCAGCGEWDCFLCDPCAAALAGPWRDVAVQAPYLQLVASPEGTERYAPSFESRFPVFAMAPYELPQRGVVLTWKNTVNRGLTEAICALFAQRVEELVPRADSRKVSSSGRPEDSSAALQLPALGKGGVDVVPAPSRFTRIHDGRFVAGSLAQAACEGLQAGGIEARYNAALRSRGARGDGLLAARRSKTRGIGLKRGARISHSTIVVDDVVTTGATLAGAANAIEGGGGHVVAAIVLLAARDPRDTGRANAHNVSRSQRDKP